MKILYIGAAGDLSTQPLRYLLQSGQQVCAIAADLTTQCDARFPVYSENQNTVESLARESGLPIINLSISLADVIAEIELFSPDIVLVSCYARKIPRAILDIPVHGSFNLHPSLLPAYRGPVPLFWQFRDGISNFGVTLHRMSDAIDAGAIVSQHAANMPDGVNHARAEQLLADAYIELLHVFLDRLASDTLSSHDQDESEMSYQGFPVLDDFRVSASWPAKRIFNFICATSHYGVPYPCEVGADVYYLQNVLGYSAAEIPEKNCVIDGDTVQLACQPGVLLARLAPVS